MRELNLFCLKKEDDAGKVNRLHHDIYEILKYFPNISIENTLDSLIYDTKPYLSDFKMPYDAFFIDKKFQTDKCAIMGIHVYDMLAMSKRLLKKQKNN